MEPRPHRIIATRIILILNLCVFGMWFFLGENQFMVDNFLVSWTGLTEGRFWTLLTSEFSHSWWAHILINMFVLNSFGALLEQVLGARRFVIFYVLAAVVSSLSHCLVSAFIIGQPNMQALGASGALAGLVLVFSLLYPREKIYLFAIIPLPAIWGALAFVGIDLWGLFAQARGGGLPIGHGAHLGGALTGGLYYLIYLRPKLRPPALTAYGG